MTLHSALATLGIAWGVAAVCMLLAWLVQLRTKDATAVDVVWAANLGIIAVLYACLGSGSLERRILTATVVAVATWRLALHLAWTRARTGVEDGRYAALRARWGRAAPISFFVYYQAQALLDVMLSLPFLFACSIDAPLGVLEATACGVWLLGLLGEGVADRQLARFRAVPTNRGRTCREGLWRFTRHPNYFCQWMLWCAYAALGQRALYGWIGWSSPLVMLALILFVTGIPPTEAQALRSRGDDYRAYQRTTNAFFPWFPRRSTA